MTSLSTFWEALCVWWPANIPLMIIFGASISVTLLLLTIGQHIWTYIDDRQMKHNEYMRFVNSFLETFYGVSLKASEDDYNQRYRMFAEDYALYYTAVIVLGGLYAVSFIIFPLHIVIILSKMTLKGLRALRRKSKVTSNKEAEIDAKLKAYKAELEKEIRNR